MDAVVLPILDANMTHGIIRAWLKHEGDPVTPGEPLFEVETDKVNAEVESEVAGTLRRILVPTGTRVAVLSLLAFVGSPEEAVPDAAEWSAPATAAPASRPPASAPPRPSDAAARPVRAAASPAARRVARDLGVALADVRGTGPRGEITSADVQAAAHPTRHVGDGRLDAEFVARLRREASAFRALSSDMKLDLYRRHGAAIGTDVRLEQGSILIAERIVIGAASMIGADSTVECRELVLGRLVAFGRRTRVRCRSLHIGDALWAKDDVTIGGGGSDEPGATLSAGDACFFGEGAYLNPGHPITLGDEVCIGSRAMLFTHSHWQSVLRGYPSLFGPVRVDDHVFIGNSAFIFPGITVGRGATVMVNSFVAVNVAPDTLVGGVPAQVIRHVQAPTLDDQIAMVRRHFLPELAQTVSERGYAVSQGNAGGCDWLRVGDLGVIQFAPAWPDVAPASGRRIVLVFDAAGAVPGTMVTVFDLTAGEVRGAQDELSDEVREFCRRRGIRFRPFAWRYRVGHFDGERFIRR